MHSLRPILALVAAAVVLAAASPALASTCTGSYTTSPGGGAASAWGYGATCAESENDLWGQAAAQAHNACISAGFDFACNVQVIETEPCYLWTGDQYITDGYANYSCKLFPR